MNLSLLKCKIHRAVVTETHVDYEGSCAIDETLLAAADLREFEQIHIWNVNSGERFTTYAIRAQQDSGIVSLNGAAAHKAKAGDLVIIAAFTSMSVEEANLFAPQLVYVDEHNRIKQIGQTLANPMAGTLPVIPTVPVAGAVFPVGHPQHSAPIPPMLVAS